MDTFQSMWWLTVLQEWGGLSVTDISTILVFSGRDSINSHFRHRNLNWAKLCSKLKWESMQQCASSVRNDTLEQKENDLWGWRKAATDKRITPLLSTPGAVTPEQGTRLKRAGPWYFFFSPHMVYVALVWVRQAHYITISHSIQSTKMFSAQSQMQHSDVWPSYPAFL